MIPKVPSVQVQPFSQKSRTPTVAKEFQIGLCGVVEADWELFCNSSSAGFFGRTAVYGVRMPTMSPSALHSGMSKKGECRHNAEVPMWQRLRSDVIHCAAYYAFCGKISPQ